MYMTFLLVLLFLLAGCAKSIPPVSTAPESLFEAHARLCPQCSKPLFSNGEENSICVEGFKLFQEDARRVQNTNTTNTGPR